MTTNSAYRPDIDGLRAVAVLSVVGFHGFLRWIGGGFIGVDIFFVISGFLITTIVFDNLQNNSFSYLDFYRRRIRRIFPALVVVLLASLGLGWFGLMTTEYQQLGKHILGGRATLLPGVLIGANAKVSAGAVVTKDVLPGTTVVGNPARKISQTSLREI